MNQTEFAKHIGATQPYVQRLIANGTLEGAYIRDERGRYHIDPQKANAIIEQNRDPARKPRRKGRPKKEQAPPAPEIPEVTDQEKQQKIQEAGLDKDGEPMTYNAARALNEKYKAALKKLEYEQKSGQTLDGEETYHHLFDIARRVRDQCLAIADRCAPLVAVKTEQHECREILLQEIRYVLDGLKSDLEGFRR